MPTRRTFLKTTAAASAAAALPRLPAFAQSPAGPPEPFTRGIGLYPGAPNESFAPTFRLDLTTYRNLALNRPATASSSYDYNLTPQLITDGIKHTQLPRWISASTSTDGTLPKPTRETFLDHWQPNTLTLTGSPASAQLQIHGDPEPPLIDHIAVFVVTPDTLNPAHITFTLSISDDGRTWHPVGSLTNPPLNTEAIRWPPDLVNGNHIFYPTIALTQPVASRHYQLELTLANVPADASYVTWRLGQIEFYRNTTRVQFGGPYDFTSAWMSAGLAEEWVTVDLGANCTFDRITLSWIARAAEGSIQTSSDAETWHTLRQLPASTSQTDDIHLTPAARARYLRVLMTRPTSPHGYILSELEVFGRGGPIPIPVQRHPADPTLSLAGGPWRLQRDSEVQAPGIALSQPTFNDTAWLPATVPGTILTSYLNAGAIPNPDYGQNQLHLSDSFFYADFWYRTTFTPPAAAGNALRWLNFEGINWKAEVFLNGQFLTPIDGAFQRARINVTQHLHPGKENVLAIRILKNETPGSCKQKTFESPSPNGGALGADNPTFHASIGWDWIPTIRGRNTGIWGDISLETTNAVTVENPFISSTLPQPKDPTSTVTIAVDLINHSSQPVSGTLHANFGERQLQQPFTLHPGAQRVSFDPFQLTDPKLWWPAGYGDPHLYKVEVWFLEGQLFSDSKAFQHGIREMTATETGHTLKLFINGRRFIPRGGNWGFAESMLRYRAREYDAAVRYHREMNFNMIRNWVGQIPDDAFYEACDRHGIVVWQDFWLANPWDGPIPNNNDLFLANARDLINRIRTHPSIGLYCGRNEWFPPPILDAGLRKLLAALHPGIHYIGSSADDVVSGHGPYRALPPTTYFERADTRLHSEIGMPNIPSIESVHAMMPAAEVWPQALSWGLHDFTLKGAQGATSFRSIIEESYGGANTAEAWISLAQFLNYEGYRAIFEAGSNLRMGILLWMSHPCWPSFVWQTYDYYLEPTAAYFACKKACEPLHIQWNRLTNFIEVVNYSAGPQPGLTATLEVLNLDASLQSTQTNPVDSSEDSVVPAIQINFPPNLTPVHFLRLTLTRGTETLSTNLYLRGLEEDNYRAIRDLPNAHLTATTTTKRDGAKWLLTTTLHNPTSTPALMVRLKAIRAISGDRILPAIYSDNYVTLFPSQTLTLTTQLNHADTRNQTPKIALSGFNLA